MFGKSGETGRKSQNSLTGSGRQEKAAKELAKKSKEKSQDKRRADTEPNVGAAFVVREEKILSKEGKQS